MKKILSLLAIVAFALALTACTPKEKQPVILAARAHTDQQDHAVHQAGMTLSLRRPTVDLPAEFH